jgi:hypothetical protein
MDKSGKVNRIRTDSFNSMSLFYMTMWVVYESMVRDDPDQNEALLMSSIVDIKTLRDASCSAITLARMIRNSLRAIYDEATILVLYLKHNHNNLTADIYRGDPVHGCDMSLAPAIHAQKVAKAARVGRV